MSDTGRPSACVQHKPKINSEERQTTLCVGCWARHPQEGCCCHSRMHETVNLPGLYEMLGKERGEMGVLCPWSGGSGHRCFRLSPLLVCCQAHTPHRHSHAERCEYTGGEQGEGGHPGAEKARPISGAAPSHYAPVKITSGWHLTSRRAGNNCFYWCSLMMPRWCTRSLVSAVRCSCVSHQEGLWLPSWFCWTGKT